MKKYDFCLLALYVCLVVVFFCYCMGVRSDQATGKEKRNTVF